MDISCPFEHSVLDLERKQNIYCVDKRFGAVARGVEMIRVSGTRRD